MNRIQANRELLNVLRRTIEKYPGLRFIQALWVCKFIDSYETEEGTYEIVDRFNEEPQDTLNRINKGMPEGKEEMNSNIPCNGSDELFICRCFNTEHQLIFTNIGDDEDHDVYVSVHLKPLSFWQRIKHGLKYIFGHRSDFGDFDEFIFKPEDADRLQRIVNYLRS